MNPLSIADHIIFAFFAFVLPLLMIWRQQPSQLVIPQDTELKIRIYWTNSMVLWIGALIVVALWFIYERSFTALGMKMPDATSFPHWVLLTAGFLLFYFIDGALSWIADDDHPAAGILPTNWREFAHFGTVVSFSAGVCEEIVFRGFIITYLLTVFQGHAYSHGIAILGSALAFGIVHAYQGIASLLKITLLSLLFAWLFIMTKSLFVLMALHVFVDFWSGLMAVLRKKDDDKLARILRY